jgi:DNA end-binding protein Ku
LAGVKDRLAANSKDRLSSRLRSLDQVAIGRVVLTNREHVIALEARDKGLMGMLLRYLYEVRDAAEYFDDFRM